MCFQGSVVRPSLFGQKILRERRRGSQGDQGRAVPERPVDLVLAWAGEAVDVVGIGLSGGRVLEALAGLLKSGQVLAEKFEFVGGPDMSLTLRHSVPPFGLE